MEREFVFLAFHIKDNVGHGLAMSIVDSRTVSPTLPPD
jgi:hypothetical protein